MLIDSHCHLDYFTPLELPAVLERAHAAGVAEMVTIATSLSDPPGTLFNAASFRDHLGEGSANAGRKVAIQVLDFLDRHGVTVRRGDVRFVNRRRAGLFG